jgi:hypothetical protein
VGVPGDFVELLTDGQLEEVVLAAIDALADSVGRGERLAGLGRLSRILDDRIGREVALNREEGASWATVATSLGVTKQAAHQRYRAAVADSVRTECVSSEVGGGSLDYLEKA